MYLAPKLLPLLNPIDSIKEIGIRHIRWILISINLSKELPTHQIHRAF